MGELMDKFSASVVSAFRRTVSGQANLLRQGYGESRQSALEFRGAEAEAGRYSVLRATISAISAVSAVIVVAVTLVQNGQAQGPGAIKFEDIAAKAGVRVQHHTRIFK